MRLRTINLLIVSLSLLIISCNQYGSGVTKALKYAGDNRAELEQVLSHYSSNKSDSLKLRAACYLIEHMPYHRSYPAKEYDEYCIAVDSLFREYTEGDTRVIEAISNLSRHYDSRLQPVFDILEITAEYLIWNIDYSFELWENEDYLQHLDFNEFCEYVLPYKCFELQPMDKWKQEWQGMWNVDFPKILQIDDFKRNVRRATEAVTYGLRHSDSLKMVERHIDGLYCHNILKPRTLAIQPFGTCLEKSKLGVFVCRSNRLPVSFDFTPNWPDRNAPHYWNHVYVSRRLNNNYEPFRINPGALHYPDNAMGKVFRVTYAPHPLLLEVVEKGGTLPSSLGQLFMQDVTDEYGRTTDITIPLLSVQEAKSDYAYLAVFNNSQWIPVDICKIKRGIAQFNKVGLDIMYMVVSYEDGVTTPISEPFYVDVRKRVNFVKTESSETVDIRLDRKCPSFCHLYNNDLYKRLVGGIIEASNNRDFSDAKVMARFSTEKFFADEVIVTDKTPYRYWRLVPTEGIISDFSELYLYERGTHNIITGSLLYPNLPIRDKAFDTPQHICDRDPLTNFTVEANDGYRWVGFDFGEPVSMEQVACVRRGDGNDICPGDDYELRYWDDGQWVTYEHKVAQDVYLEFENVPANRLYHIRGLSRGNQNRIFIYKDGTVRWY